MIGEGNGIRRFSISKRTYIRGPMSKEERSNRPLSKFTQDIMDEMNSI